jgi:flagellar FliL protein
MSDTNEPAKQGGKMTLIIAAVAVLAAGGAGGYWYMHRGAAPKHAEEPATEHGIVTFEPFVVNLADPNSARYLRTTVQLVVSSKTQAEHVSESPVVLMQARSAILELLTQQTSDRLVTIDGKAALKKAIAERVGAVLGETKVVDVLFSDFVVQL